MDSKELHQKLKVFMKNHEADLKSIGQALTDEVGIYSAAEEDGKLVIDLAVWSGCAADIEQRIPKEIGGAPVRVTVRAPLAVEAVNFLSDAKTAADVDFFFAKLAHAGLDDAAYKVLIAEVEKEICADYDIASVKQSEIDMLKLYLTMAEAAFEKKLPGGKAAADALINAKAGDSILEAQAMSQVMLHLNQLRGPDAQPLVKAYVEEAAKLSDEEFNSPLSQMRLYVVVAERLKAQSNAPAPKAKPSNPFRPK